MNIAGINLAAVTASAVSTEAGASPLLAESGLPEGFASTFFAQLDLLNAIETPIDPAALTSSQASAAVTVLQPEQQTLLSGEPNNDHGQQLAALLGNDLPVSYKVAEQAPDPNLAAVTDAINYINAGQTPAAPAAQAPVNQASELQQPIPVNPAPEITTTPAIVEEQIATQPPIAENQQTLSADQTQMGGSHQDASAKTVLNTDKKQQDASEDSSVAAVVATVALSVPASSVQQPIKFEAASAKEGAGKVSSGMSTSSAIDGDNDSIPKQGVTQTILQSAPSAPSEQWQSFSSDQKNTTDQQLSAVSADSNAAANVGVDSIKLDKLAQQNQEVPALTKPLTHPDWNKDVGERILWMNNKSIPTAEIKLNPQHLGPITVRIDMNQDQASVSFSAQHGVVRDALEAAIPKLREMLSAQNITLTDVNVSQQSTSNQSQSQAQNFAQMAKQQEQTNPAEVGEDNNSHAEELDSSAVRVSNGLLSMYA